MWGVVAAAILHLASHRAGSEPPINGKIGCVESYVCSKKTMLMEPHRAGAFEDTGREIIGQTHPTVRTLRAALTANSSSRRVRCTSA
jgi:hypothetical protein